MVEAENCPYYKMRRLDLLQNAAHFISKCPNRYQKMRDLLQNDMCRYYKMPQNRYN